MNQEQAAILPETPVAAQPEQSSMPVAQVLSEQLDDSELDVVVGGDGSPQDPPQREITIFRSPV